MRYENKVNDKLKDAFFFKVDDRTWINLNYVLEWEKNKPSNSDKYIYEIKLREIVKNENGHSISFEPNSGIFEDFVKEMIEHFEVNIKPTADS